MQTSATKDIPYNRHTLKHKTKVCLFFFPKSGYNLSYFFFLLELSTIFPCCHFNCLPPRTQPRAFSGASPCHSMLDVYLSRGFLKSWSLPSLALRKAKSPPNLTNMLTDVPHTQRSAKHTQELSEQVLGGSRSCSRPHQACGELKGESSEHCMTPCDCTCQAHAEVGTSVFLALQGFCKL